MTSPTSSHYDVSADDEMVVDKEGTIWVYLPDTDKWSYITDDGIVNKIGLTEWDNRVELPEPYQPYTKLDSAAIAIIRKGLK